MSTAKLLSEVHFLQDQLACDHTTIAECESHMKHLVYKTVLGCTKDFQRQRNLMFINTPENPVDTVSESGKFLVEASTRSFL